MDRHSSSEFMRMTQGRILDLYTDRQIQIESAAQKQRAIDIVRNILDGTFDNNAVSSSNIIILPMPAEGAEIRQELKRLVRDVADLRGHIVEARASFDAGENLSPGTQSDGSEARDLDDAFNRTGRSYEDEMPDFLLDDRAQPKIDENVLRTFVEMDFDPDEQVVEKVVARPAAKKKPKKMPEPDQVDSEKMSLGTVLGHLGVSLDVAIKPKGMNDLLGVSVPGRGLSKLEGIMKQAQRDVLSGSTEKPPVAYRAKWMQQMWRVIVDQEIAKRKDAPAPKKEKAAPASDKQEVRKVTREKARAALSPIARKVLHDVQRVLPTIDDYINEIDPEALDQGDHPPLPPAPKVRGIAYDIFRKKFPDGFGLLEFAIELSRRFDVRKKNGRWWYFLFANRIEILENGKYGLRAE